MSRKVEVDVVRVFTDDSGNYGNPVGIVVDIEQRLGASDRQAIAAELGYSETVFFDDINEPKVEIYDTKHRVRFAGHAMVGAAWFLATTRDAAPSVVRCSNMAIHTRREGDTQWVRASMDLMPEWNHEQLPTPDQVEAITDEAAQQKKHVFVWAWKDEEQGIVRARTFLPDWGILEDQGNGSGSMQCAVRVGRKIIVHHGQGSVIYALPIGEDEAEVGGRAVLDSQRTITLAG